jgi:hypothetical protein
MRVPSTRSVRRDGVSAMDILSMLRLYPTRARTGPGYRKTFAKATWLTPWQPVESVRAGQTGDGVCRRLSRSIDNCREWGQIKRRKLSHGVAQERPKCRVPRATAWSWRHSSGRAAENHRGKGEAPFVPGL